MRCTGTDTSCLMLAPSGRCASDTASRRRQKSRACASEPAIAASTIRPFSVAASSALSICCSAEPSAFSPDISSNTYQAYFVANGSRAPARFFSTKSMTMRGMNSKAVRPVPAVSCARLNRPSADLKSGMATIAVAFSTGRGNSFSTAAVMMPSVPSEPMNRSLRS